jgi:hypothetical protein
VGHCVTCDWTSPARRARYSVEADMAAHEVLCRSAVAVDSQGGSEVRSEVGRGVGGELGGRTDGDLAVPSTAPASAGAPEVVTSGRERLSAQGRS